MDVQPAPGVVRVCLNGALIAESQQAVVMHEGNHPPRYYLPLSDIDANALEANDHSSYCPFKGTARYWTVRVGGADGAQVDNGAWAYDAPYAECLSIAGLVAFYNEKFELSIDGG